MGDYLVVLLDTCALIWYTLDPEKLSSKALSFLFENYIKEVRKLANTVDQLTI